MAVFYPSSDQPAAASNLSAQQLTAAQLTSAAPSPPPVSRCVQSVPLFGGTVCLDGVVGGAAAVAGLVALVAGVALLARDLR